MHLFDAAELRAWTKVLTPGADLDGQFTFYYDETNNIGKFYVRENDFNTSFVANFVLGGLVHEGSPPNVEPFIDSLRLQKNVKEVKFKHIASGDFLECLKSKKLLRFLRFLIESKLYIHYSSLNILYWALVDIVDSAIVNSDVSRRLGPEFGQYLKNDLYKLCRLEIKAVVNLFYTYDYPNIKAGKIEPFIIALTALFADYIDTPEFHFGLESLRQILKESDRKGRLPFIMDEEDHVLLRDLSQFYLRPIYTFKNSKHIFDNEKSISEIIRDFKIMDGNEEIKDYSFVDSQSNKFVQLSDVFVGLLGKLHIYLNSNVGEKIISDINRLTSRQRMNLHALIDLIDKSNDRNIAFLHAMDSHEELAKMNIIREVQGKL